MKKALVDNASDPKQVRVAGEKETRRRERELDDVFDVCQTPGGRRFYHRIMEQCGIFRTSYFPGNPSEHTAFNEGKRNIGLMLMADIDEACPKALDQMRKESRQDHV